MRRRVNWLQVLVAAVVATAVSWAGVWLEGEYSPFGGDAAVEFETLLKADTGFFLFFRENFPQEYGMFEQRTLAAYRSKMPSNQIQQIAHDEIAAFRRNNASFIASAPDEALMALVVAHTRLRQAIQLRQGNKICADFEQRGMPAIADQSNLYLSEILETSTQTFKAIKSGMKSAERAAPATSDDWNDVVEVMKTQGAPERYLEVIAEENPADPDYCSALISFVKAVSSAQGEGSRRVRAELLSEIAAQ